MNCIMNVFNVYTELIRQNNQGGFLKRYGDLKNYIRPLYTLFYQQSIYKIVY